MIDLTLNLRKSIALEELIPLLTQAEDIDYWRMLNPNSTICDRMTEIYDKVYLKNHK